MTGTMYVWLALALLLANLPFISVRRFGVLPLANKHFGHHALELLLGFVLVLGLAYVLESRSGMVHKQGWEFYAVLVCLYLVFAFPAFVWRYFWRGKHKE